MTYREWHRRREKHLRQVELMAIAWGAGLLGFFWIGWLVKALSK